MDIYNKPSPQAYLLRCSKSPPQKYLAHHGILGQRWGRRNGPPYPLDASDHSASEKKAGWRKSLDKGGKKEDNKKQRKRKDITTPKSGLTDKQKRALKMGAALAVTALAVYGGYKLKQSGKLDQLVEKGKKLFDDTAPKNASKPVSNFGSESLGGSSKSPFGEFDFSTLNSQQAAKTKPVTEVIHGFKKLAHQESLADTLKKTNPNRGNTLYKNNCVLCSIASFMRQAGYDVTAGQTGGVQLNPAGVVEKCFKGAKIVEGSAIKFGRSQNDAAEMLLKRFGQNASGLCNIQWKGGVGGHAFSWKIVDGVVSFFDAQTGSTDVSSYWNGIDPMGNLTLARLDNLEIDFDAISEYLEKN